MNNIVALYFLMDLQISTPLYGSNPTVSTMMYGSNPTEIFTHSYVSSFSNKYGRTPNLFDMIIVTFMGEKYIVLGIQYKSSVKYSVFDYSDLLHIEGKHWHISSGKYIAKNFTCTDGTIKEVYIHNYLMNNINDALSQEKKYVIHINTNTLDNRRANLKVVSEADLFKYTAKKKRTIQLPPDLNISVNDVPRYVSYIKPTGNHSDRFSIEIPHLNIVWKSTSSKKKSIQEKYKETLERVSEIKLIYPEVFADDTHTDLSKKLELEFVYILNLANIITEKVSTE